MSKTAPSLKRAVGVRIGLLFAFLVFALFAPAGLGGRVSYVTTSGVSMQPEIHAGDLVVVRRSSSYHVGEVVAYRSPQLDGTVVLHRIIAIHGDRYSFKGDNNNFVDPGPALRSQLVGRMWIHVPRVGGFVHFFTSPGRVALIAALLVIGLGAGANERRRRRRRPDGPARPWTARLPLPPIGAATVESLVKPALAFVAAGVLLAVVAFSRPTAHAATRSVSYSQAGVFGYSADSRDPTLYPGGRATTGDPIFTRQSDEVRLSFAYRLTSAAPTAVTGAADLAATLRDSTGWHQSIELQDWRHFAGGAVTLHGTLSLARLRALIDRLDAATGVSHGSFTLDVTPHVAASGSVSGEPLRTSFKPTLSFVLDSNQLQLSGGISDGTSDATRPSATGSVAVPSSAPSVLAFSRIRARVVVARRLALALIALGLGGLLLLGALRRAEREVDEAAQIASRYRSLLVPVAALDRRAYPQIVELASMDALARVAAGYDRMILHERSDAGHAYFVIDDGVVHAYRIGEVPLTPPPPSPPQPEQGPEIRPAKGHLGLVRSVS